MGCETAHQWIMLLEVVDVVQIVNRPPAVELVFLLNEGLIEEVHMPHTVHHSDNSPEEHHNLDEFKCHPVTHRVSQLHRHVKLLKFVDALDDDDHVPHRAHELEHLPNLVVHRIYPVDDQRDK